VSEDNDNPSSAPVFNSTTMVSDPEHDNVHLLTTFDYSQIYENQLTNVIPIDLDLF